MGDVDNDSIEHGGSILVVVFASLQAAGKKAVVDPEGSRVEELNLEI